MPKTILVTGCAGFIASRFVKQFRQKYPDTIVVGIDDFSTGRRDAVDPSISFYEGSIVDKELLEKIFTTHAPEYVFHFAAQPRVVYSIEHPYETTQANVLGTVALLEASKNHNTKRLIYSSSSAIYGKDKELPTKESSTIGSAESPYGLQKYIGELYCVMFGKLFDFDTICLRYFNVFGPGQYGDSPYSTVISAWLESLFFSDRKKGFIEGDGEQSRDFCYVDNVISANILAMSAAQQFRGDAFNIAHGERTSLNEIKKLIKKYTQKDIILEQRPSRLGDIRDSHADISKAKEMLGYAPKINFEEGLRATIQWQQSRKI